MALGGLPSWYQALSEPERWQVQARFWRAVAAVGASSAVLCYELTSEPAVGDSDGWYSGVLVHHHVQYVRGWAFDPRNVADLLDIVRARYPATGKAGEALALIRYFAHQGKPLMLGETLIESVVSRASLRVRCDDAAPAAREAGAAKRTGAEEQTTMTVVQEPPRLEEHDAASTPRDAALDGLAQEVRRQGRQIRSAQRAFSIFAVLAFLIAMVSLLAVALKLDAPSKTVVRNVVPPAAAAPTPAVHNVDVTLAQFAVTPTVGQASAGKITFRVHNAGTITHEFVVLKTPHAAADVPLKNGRADESGNVGETGDLEPGRTKSVTFKLAPGHYVFICNLPGHYVAGQHTDFTVR